MEIPVGMKEVFSSPDETYEETTCYQLLKGIYGLCQSARQFWKSLSMKGQKLMLVSN